MHELVDILKGLRWHIVVLLLIGGLIYLSSAVIKAQAMSGPVSAEWFREEHRVHKHLIFSIILFAAAGVAARLLKPDKYR